MRAFTATPIFTARDPALSWNYYLDGTPASPYAAAARATDLTGLPPAFVLTCDQDPLCDEGIAYAGRLIAAGVPTDLHHYAGTVHGFDMLATSLSQEARATQTAALRRALR
jgi:acetyl esterase